MKYQSIDLEKKAAYTVAELMAAAAKTAPKACGIDNVETVVLDGKEKDDLTVEMRKIAKDPWADFFKRDAANVDSSHCIVLIGVKDSPIGTPGRDFCGLCGLSDCAETKKVGARCAFNIADLGIAVGSAVSIAADHRIDNRILFSAGMAALSIGVFPKDVKTCFGIPLSTSSKNIFFDRDSTLP